MCHCRFWDRAGCWWAQQSPSAFPGLALGSNYILLCVAVSGVPATVSQRGLMGGLGEFFLSCWIHKISTSPTRRSPEANLGRDCFILVGRALCQDKQELNSDVCCESSVLGGQVPALCTSHRLSDILRMLQPRAPSLRNALSERYKGASTLTSQSLPSRRGFVRQFLVGWDAWLDLTGRSQGIWVLNQSPELLQGCGRLGLKLYPVCRSRRLPLPVPTILSTLTTKVFLSQQQFRDGSSASPLSTHPLLPQPLPKSTAQCWAAQDGSQTLLLLGVLWKQKDNC